MSDSERNDDENCECGKCGKIVKESDKAFKCDACNIWSHIKCINVTNDMYAAAKKNQDVGIKWFCNNCDKVVSKFLKGMFEIQERQNKLEDDMKQVLIELAGIKGSTTGNNISSFAQIMKEESQLATCSVGDRQIDRNMQMQITEALEREKRKNNLVLMGIPEQQDDLVGHIEKIIKESTGGTAIFEIVGRIGKSELKDKTRPLRILMEDPIARRKILRGASSLKGKKDFDKVYIVPDHTRKQQEQDKLLRDKVKQFREEGKTGVKISKGEVVQIRGEEKEVLFKVSN